MLSHLSAQAEQAALHETMADPAFYQLGKEDITAATARAESIPHELELCFERWEELEGL